MNLNWDTPYIVAVTALAEGFENPHVRLVMNVDEPELLIMFAQRSGRAGGDGKRVVHIDGVASSDSAGQSHRRSARHAGYE